MADLLKQVLARKAKEKAEELLINTDTIRELMDEDPRGNRRRRQQRQEM